jgi:hypothetical protein
MGFQILRKLTKVDYLEKCVKNNILMKTLYKKSAYLGLVMAVTLLFSSAFTSVANASSSDDNPTPHINKINDVTRRTAVLPVQFRHLKNMDVVASVRITDKDNGAVMIQEFNLSLNGSGRADITVKNLMPNTKYSFKVKIRRDSSRHFSDSSDSRTATTTR